MERPVSADATGDCTCVVLGLATKGLPSLLGAKIPGNKDIEHRHRFSL